jgi:hypothetical protein
MLRSEIHELNEPIERVDAVAKIYIRIADIQYFYTRRHNFL